MANLLKWPGVWFNMLLKPGKTAAMLKSEKPGLIDGITSFGLCNMLIGLLIFLLAAAFSLLGMAIGADVGGSILSIVIFFVILVVGYPIFMILLLLLIGIAFTLASKILKGNASFGERCGMLGVIGSPTILVMLAMYLIMFVLAFFAALIGGILNLGFASTILVYLFISVAYLIIMPPMYLLWAEAFDLIAAVEKVSIYRAGAIVGLAVGILFFVMMLAFSLLIFALGGVMQLFMGGMEPGF